MCCHMNPPADTLFMNVLLIDDDATFRFIVQTICSKSGMAQVVHESLNGQEAIDYIKSNLEYEGSLPDLILLDLNMPVMDGWEFLDRLPKLVNGRIAELPVVILTSSINTQDRDRAQKYTFVKGVFSKPLTASQLEQMQDLLHA